MIVELILRTPNLDYPLTDNIAIVDGKINATEHTVKVDGVETDAIPVDNKFHAINITGPDISQIVGKGYVGAIYSLTVDGAEYDLTKGNIVSQVPDNEIEGPVIQFKNVKAEDYEIPYSGTIYLCTKDFYTTNKTEIDALSAVGQPAEIYEIDNYQYIASRDTSFDFVNTRNMPKLTTGLDDQVQQDLTDLRNEVFNAYVCSDAQFNLLDTLQRTPGEFSDTCVFSRFISDPPYNNNEWKLALYRESTENFSIEVLHAEDDSWWYTPGAFSEVTPGVWEIKSWDGDVQSEPQECAFVFIHGSRRVSEIYHVSADRSAYKFQINYGDSTPTAGDDTGGDTWIDSGQTAAIIGAGTYSVQDSSVFTAGQRIKMEDVETTIDRIHSATIIVTTDHIAITNGAAIWVLE